MVEYEEPHPGDGLVNLTYAGTGALVGTGLAAGLAPDTFAIVHAVLSVLLFAVGTGAMLWGYALGVSRSRTLVIPLAGLFFLAMGAAPPDTRRRFRIALAVEIVAVVTAALIRPDTEAAFGVLAPIFGLGLMTMWGGRFGSFAARSDVPAP